MPSHHFFSDCNGVRLVGGYNIFIGDRLQPVSFTKTWTNLPPHYSVSITMTLYKIDVWDSESLFILLDNSTAGVYTWNNSTGISDICGD